MAQIIPIRKIEKEKVNATIEVINKHLEEGKIKEIAAVIFYENGDIVKVTPAIVTDSFGMAGAFMSMAMDVLSEDPEDDLGR